MCGRSCLARANSDRMTATSMDAELETPWATGTVEDAAWCQHYIYMRSMRRYGVHITNILKKGLIRAGGQWYGETFNSVEYGY